MSGPELFKAGKYAEGTSASDEGARLSWRALKWLVIGTLCLIAGVAVWAILPRWVTVWSVDTARPAQAWIHADGELRITAERVSKRVVHSVAVRLTAAETGPFDPTAAQPFRVTRTLDRSGTLLFEGLAAGDYSVKVIPEKGSRWLVTVKDHRSWGSLPW